MAKIKNFTNDELEYIKNEYLKGKSIKNIAEEFCVGFDTISSYLKKISVFKYKNRRWSDEEIQFLKDNYSTCDWNIILNYLSRWKKSEIISKASRLNLKRETYFWSDSDLEKLKQYYLNKVSVKEIEKKLGYKFTQTAILTKAYTLGLHQRDWWTDEEDKKLIEVYHSYDMDEICGMFQNRSRDAIIAHAVKLELSYKTIWTDEELKFLKDNYSTMSDEEIGKHLGRSKDSIRGKRFVEKLYHPIEHGVYNYLSEYIRKRNKEWKRRSAKQCNYKCVVTGKRFQEIHHLYSMNKILQETLLDLDYPENISISNLSQNDLDLILNHFYEVQGKYPLGICLSKDIHKQFHDSYGYGNNTPEQFDDFILSHNYNLNIA